MPKVYIQKIRLKTTDKVYEQFRTAIPKWVISNLGIKHGDTIGFEISKKTGNIEVRKKK